jgi:uncharacterized membrane protein/murein tripeptide amidase MpaA
MKKSITLRRGLNLIILLVLLISSGSPVMADSTVKEPAAQTIPENPVVAVIYFNDNTELNQLATVLDIWEVHHDQGYLIALLSPEKFASLQGSGYRMEIDEEKTALLNNPLQMLPGQVDGIPGYPCYRTVEETFDDMGNLAIMHPNIASWIDIGDSWEKATPGGLTGYDIFALILTNENIPGPKPTFFLMAEIHAREYTTAELAARFAEELVANYGVDPDVTWLLDYFEVHIVPMTNPDGRKIAETGDWWRKNTDSDDGCNNSSWWGTDLNRNHSFKWNMGGSSGDPCDETYHGPSAGSEPEVQAIEDYVLTLFPDQRGPGDNDPAPVDTTGVFITLHSYSQLVLWPWGWTSQDAPNHTQLQTLGRKFAYFNGYQPMQSYNLYQTSGTSDEFAYGTLGVAGYTFEMGTDFFQSCDVFENTIVPDNMPALYTAFKAARRPYMNPAGPDTLDVLAAPDSVIRGDPVTLTAVANDTRYSNLEPTQNIQAARYSFDDPSWITGTLSYTMSASDGSFNETVEDVVAIIDTSGLEAGDHTIFVESQDEDGNWGSPSAVFLNVIFPDYGASLSPESDSQQADPGAVVTYTLEIHNYGANADTYTVALESNWNATAPVSIGPIASLDSATFDVSVTIPPSATNGESDTATVQIQSQADPSVSDSATLQTTANFYNMSFSPEQDSQYGLPGTDVIYTFEVTNLGNLVDTFDLVASGTWTVIAPSTVGPLDPGESAAFDVTVQIPGTAQPGDNDVATLTLSSQGDETKSVTSQLTTTAGVLGPLVSPTEITLSGDPGTDVVYPLTITNKYTAVENFYISVSGNSWEVNAPLRSGLIAPNQYRVVEVTVSIPADAVAGSNDTAVIEITSDKPNVVPAYANLTTVANNFYALAVAAETDTLIASQPGESVTFLLDITNLGSAVDTFDLAASSDWMVSLPETVGPLAPVEIAGAEVTVTVPADASSGEVNATTVTVTSQADPQVTGQIILTTRLLGHLTFLPISFKP